MYNLNYVVVAYVHQARASRAHVQPYRESFKHRRTATLPTTPHDISEARRETRGRPEVIWLNRQQSIVLGQSDMQLTPLVGALGDTVTI